MTPAPIYTPVALIIAALAFVAGLALLREWWRTRL